MSDWMDMDFIGGDPPDIPVEPGMPSPSKVPARSELFKIQEQAYKSVRELRTLILDDKLSNADAAILKRHVHATYRNIQRYLDDHA